MSKIIRINMVDTDTLEILSHNSKYMQLSDIENIAHKIHVDTITNVNPYIEFETDIPSNQSFMIFGGMYDPKTGILYGTLNKNMDSLRNLK